MIAVYYNATGVAAEVLWQNPRNLRWIGEISCAARLAAQRL
jgi:hypothetical protein